MMKNYEIELEGFRGDTDETDNLIKWVRARSKSEAENWATYNGWKNFKVKEIYEDEDLGFDDGIDAVTDERGAFIKATL